MLVCVQFNNKKNCLFQVERFLKDVLKKMEYFDVGNKKMHKKKKARLYDIFVNFNVQKIKFSKFQKVS